MLRGKIKKGRFLEPSAEVRIGLEGPKVLCLVGPDVPLLRAFGPMEAARALDRDATVRLDVVMLLQAHTLALELDRKDIHVRSILRALCCIFSCLLVCKVRGQRNGRCG